jgi:phosphoglycolate phosphatase-like HAD superfamily hydrolase
MRLSRQRATEGYGESFACTVYVGDGVWDARACRSVGIPFIGIGTGSRATRLSAEVLFVSSLISVTRTYF